MSAERGFPEKGETITFEKHDCESIRERFTVRVLDAERAGMGMVAIFGVLIGANNLPEREIRVNVLAATIEARRVSQYIWKP